MNPHGVLTVTYLISILIKTGAITCVYYFFSSNIVRWLLNWMGSGDSMRRCNQRCDSRHLTL